MNIIGPNKNKTLLTV